MTFKFENFTFRLLRLLHSGFTLSFRSETNSTPSQLHFPLGNSHRGPPQSGPPSSATLPCPRKLANLLTQTRYNSKLQTHPRNTLHEPATTEGTPCKEHNARLVLLLRAKNPPHTQVTLPCKPPCPSPVAARGDSGNEPRRDDRRQTTNVW